MAWRQVPGAVPQGVMCLPLRQREWNLSMIFNFVMVKWLKAQVFRICVWLKVPRDLGVKTVMLLWNLPLKQDYVIKKATCYIANGFSIGKTKQLFFFFIWPCHYTAFQNFHIGKAMRFEQNCRFIPSQGNFAIAYDFGVFIFGDFIQTLS